LALKALKDKASTQEYYLRNHRKGYSLSILFLLIARELRAIGNKERIGIGRKKKLKNEIFLRVFEIFQDFNSTAFILNILPLFYSFVSAPETDFIV